MPVHDWTRVDAGIFHAFHHDRITYLSRALNRGLLPAEYYALPEQIAGGPGSDVLTLPRPVGNGDPADPGAPSGGTARDDERTDRITRARTANGVVTAGRDTEGP
jgi:hypothetical protein